VKPSPETRDDTVDGYRERITDAALHLFAERGYHGTAVPLIARRAGVGPGTIYRRFADKADLVNAVFREAKGRLGVALLDGDRVEDPPAARFEALWLRLFRFARREPITVHFLELQDHQPYLDPASRAVELDVLGPIFSTLAGFRAEGHLADGPPLDALIAALWGAFVGLVKAERAGYLTLTEDTVRALACSAWRGIEHRAEDAE